MRDARARVLRCSRSRARVGGLATLLAVVLGGVWLPGEARAERGGCQVWAPVSLSAEATPNGAVRLQWSNVPTALGYEIFNLAHGPEPVGSVSGLELTFEDFLVPQCQEQTYFVRAYGSDSCVSGPSPFASATPVLVASSHETADFDGDGITDPSVFDPATGRWTWLPSIGGGQVEVDWGQAGDLPVAADYDGDGTTDVAIFRPSTGKWWIQASCGLATHVVLFGADTDIPVPADYDGDGKADLAIFRPSTGEWWGIQSSNGASFTAAMGRAEDIPVPGDYDGDGKADLAVYRPDLLDWQIFRSSDSSEDFVTFGASGGVPAPADFDGDGRTDPSLLTSSGATWKILSLASGPDGETHEVSTPMVWAVPGNYDPTSPGAEMMVIVESVLDHAWIEESSKGVVQEAHTLGASGSWPIPGLLLALLP